MSEDPRWRELLELFRVPRLPGIYVLGSFARRVTFYSQQVRALNLIDVLCKRGEVHENSTIAIVGAGLAGVTAAVAARRRGLKVIIFEAHHDRDNNPHALHLQQLSDERAVHPHVYDWPAHSLDDDEPAGLPALDWHAGTAAEIVGELRNEFESEVRNSQGEITLVSAEVTERMVEPGSPVGITVDGKTHQVDALILAVGFGREHGESYWNNDGLAGRTGEWLVSGAGDGGLTDLMRLCVENFRHATVVRIFGMHDDVARPLLDEDRRPTGVALAELYRDAARKLIQRLPANAISLRNREVSVWLCATEDRLFSPGASVLNRLIAAYLLERGMFELIPHYTAHVELTANNKKRVVYTDDLHTKVPIDVPTLKREFDGVVERHGVESALKKYFPSYYARCRKLESLWKAQTRDITKEPLADQATWKLQFDATTAPPLDVDSISTPLVVVVSGDTDGEIESLQSIVETALGRLQEADAPKPRVVHIHPQRELAAVDRYRRVLRALCRSEIVIFDITGSDQTPAPNPATMLLLGIRSVVRRGITLSTLRIREGQRKLPPFDIPMLPFNIRETSVIARREDTDTFTNAIERAISEGRNQMQLIRDVYQDLPAYDAVRQLGPRPENHRPVAPSSSVLVLSSYGERYLSIEGPGQFLATALTSAVGRDRWLRIVESPSPQLASQKLYAAIRRSQMCVVDWTDWRANVFFELGVRLAVNEHEPVCLIHQSSTRGAQGEAATLLALFANFEYHASNKGELIDYLKRHKEAIEASRNPTLRENAPTATDTVNASGARSSVAGSRAYTFAEVERWTDVRTEAPPSVENALESDAAALVGPDPITNPDSPMLYRGNGALVYEAQRAALDRWIAAWLFLGRLHGIEKHIAANKAIPRSPAADRWLGLAARIATMIDSSYPIGYGEIKADADKAMTLPREGQRQ